MEIKQCKQIEYYGKGVDGVDDFSCIFGTHRSWLFHRHFVSPAMSRRHLGSWGSKTSHPLEHVRMDYSSILGQKHLSSCPTPSRMATSFFALFLGIRSGNAHQSIYIFSRKKRTFSLTCNLAGPQSDPIASSGFFQPNLCFAVSICARPTPCHSTFPCRCDSQCTI